MLCNAAQTLKSRPQLVHYTLSRLVQHIQLLITLLHAGCQGVISPPQNGGILL